MTTPSSDIFSIGTLVALHGLTAAHHLNGRRGLVASGLSPKGRFKVKLFPIPSDEDPGGGSGDQLEFAVKPDNMKRQNRREIGEHSSGCYGCKKHFPDSKLRVCTKCKIAQYCSDKCQRKDWKAGHKILCPKFRQQRKAVSSSRLQDDEGGEDSDISAQSLLMSGRRLHGLGDYSKAEKVFLEAIEKFSSSDEHPDFHIGLAMCKADQGRDDEAVQIMKRVVRMTHHSDKHHASSYRNLAVALTRQGDYEGAIEAYKRS